jgi:RNA polymerase sigma-70 factor, ECF subfamily
VSDEELIRSYVQQGDERAFEALIARHRGFVRRILFGVFGGWPEEAEEAEQEVLIALSRDLARFAYKAAFTTYLYRLVRNKGLDSLRALRRRRRRFLPQVQDIPDTGGAQRNVLDNEEREFLYAVLARLTEKERSLLLLKELDGFSLRETAELMGIPEGTAKSRLHRARGKAAKIAAELNGNGGGDNRGRRK